MLIIIHYLSFVHEGKIARLNIRGKEINFIGKLLNVYTKEEVDALIASGGGGGTGNYHGPVTNSIVESSGYGRAWILNYTQSALDYCLLLMKIMIMRLE